MKVLAGTVLFLSLTLVAVGSVVSSSGYGLAIPDWPLALGTLIPHPLVGGIAWEFAHRVLSLVTGLATFVLAGLMLAATDALQRRIGIAMMVLIVAQILLGGIGVLHEFPWLMKVMHASLAHLFVGTVAAAVAVTAATGRTPRDRVEEGAVRRTRALASMVVLQLVAGAVVRHAETKTVMLAALLLHLVLAIGVTVSGLSIALRMGSAFSGGKSRLAYAIGGAIVVQILLGFTVLLNAPEPGATGQQSSSYI